MAYKPDKVFTPKFPKLNSTKIRTKKDIPQN